MSSSQPSSPPRKAPAAKKPKASPAAPAGVKDIRSFFGGSGSSSSTPTPAVASSSTASAFSSKSESKAEMNSSSIASKPYGSKPAPIDIDSSDDGEMDVKPIKTVPAASKASGTKRALQVDDAESSEEDRKPAIKKAKVSPAKKRGVSTATMVIDSSEEDVKPVVKKPVAAAPAKAPASKKASVKKEKRDDDYEMEGVVEEKKPQIAAKLKPAPKAKKEKYEDDFINDGEDKVPKAEKPKFNWAAAAARKAAGPTNPGGKDIPNGAPNCLAGLTFVFTGELESLSREEAQELAKRYGGKVTGAPSSKTSYVVLGADAGPSKLEKIKKFGLKTLDEDGFLGLIGSRGGGEVDEKTKKKMKEEEEKIKQAAREMETREREAEIARLKAAKKQGSSPSKSAAPASAQLWTTKYAPQSQKEICGNKGQVEKLMEWLTNWQNNAESHFKKPGKNATGTFRAVLISGPPGIGKTSAAHIVAKACGYNPIEMNASDSRSKKLIENGTNIDNSSLDGWMKGTGSTTAAGITVTHKTCLIMDEVDGMSGGDRGGVGAMNALVKKTKIPIILICNDKSNPKMKPLIPTTFQMPFKRPSAQEIRSRIMSIAFKEKIKLEANAVDQLVAGSQSDIRQVLNMLSTWKLSSNKLDFDDGKALAADNTKYTILSPFDINNKLFGPYMFSHTNKMSLTEKMDYYYMDFGFVPLFAQDNYLKNTFARASSLSGHEKTLKTLTLMDQAASSISDGDLVDGMIHGTQQHWSLLPVHAVMSTIRPAYFCYGSGGGWGSQYGMSFPQWLGQNSKRVKLQKMLNEIQIRMRLKVSGDGAELRQHYLPALFPKLVSPLMSKEASVDVIEEVIETMDEYFLTKEDWDAMVELGIGQHKEETILKQIPSGVKSSFTRTYNKADHPIPFHKGIATSTGKKISAAVVADHEDVHEAEIVSEEEVVSDEENEDISKDKLVKQKKQAVAKGSKASGSKVGAKSKASPKKR